MRLQRESWWWWGATGGRCASQPVCLAVVVRERESSVATGWTRLDQTTTGSPLQLPAVVGGCWLALLLWAPLLHCRAITDIRCYRGLSHLSHRLVSLTSHTDRSLSPLTQTGLSHLSHRPPLTPSSSHHSQFSHFSYFSPLKLHRTEHTEEGFS